MRGDLFALRAGFNTAGFNPRPFVRGDLASAVTPAFFTTFQSTPLREGRPMVDLPLPPPTSFNPRPFVRGDIADAPVSGRNRVSIHAPS